MPNPWPEWRPPAGSRRRPLAKSRLALAASLVLLTAGLAGLAPRFREAVRAPAATFDVPDAARRPGAGPAKAVPPRDAGWLPERSR
jgi:hypothetical protein